MARKHRYDTRLAVYVTQAQWAKLERLVQADQGSNCTSDWVRRMIDAQPEPAQCASTAAQVVHDSGDSPKQVNPFATHAPGGGLFEQLKRAGVGTDGR
jgi:hypothetical protein